MIQNTVNPSATNGKNAEQSCTLLENFSQGESSFFQHVIGQIRDVIWVVDEEGKILSVNHAAEAIYGYSVSELINMSVHDLRHIDAKSTIDEQLKLAQEDGMLFQTLHCRKSGETLAVEVSSRRMNYRERTLIVSVTRDITERVALQDELYNKKKDLQDAHERLLNAYEELQYVHEELLASDEATKQQFDELLTKERKIERQNIVLKLVNQMAMELMNRRDLGEVLHTAVRGATAMLNTAHGFLSLVDEKEGVFVRKISLGVFAEDGRDRESLATGLLSQAYLSGEVVLAKACRQGDEQEDNMQRYCSRLIVVVPLKVGTSVIGVLGVAISEPDRILSDDEIYILQRIAELTSIAIDDAVLVQSCKQELMERARAEAVIRRMAYYDSLTGLPNKAMLQEHLAKEMERVSKNEFGGAVFFIDIDDFKIVNEKFGHTCGNQVIAQFGANIAAALGENCVVARIGGDEFVAVLQGVEDGCKAEELAAHLSGRIGRDYDLGMSMFRLTASIGIALYPKDGDAVDRILKNADMALYEAKKRGKNTWLLFDYDLAKATYEGIALKQGLRKAVERGELRLEFQPLVESNSYRIVSFEALLRWQSDEFGLVPPDKFIPLAEECGEIKLIGKWVIREACAFARRLRNLGRADVHVTVNVSPRQLATEDFVPFLMGEVSDAGINVNQLEIEITENALIGSMAESVEKLEILREAGIGVLLDDFGIGYSSLAYLKSLPVSIVKIDKTFIDEIVTSAAELRFVQAIIYMAHGQNLCVAAEGVETENQVNALRDCGCDYIQGYFFSRPISADAAMSLLVSDW